MSVLCWFFFIFFSTDGSVKLLLTLFRPRMTKTIKSQKNMAMTTEPMGTISSTLVFSSAPEKYTNNATEGAIYRYLSSPATEFSDQSSSQKVDVALRDIQGGFPSLYLARTCERLRSGWRKETAGIWTVSKLIFYPVITNTLESGRTALAKNNLEKANQTRSRVSLQATTDHISTTKMFFCGGWVRKGWRSHVYSFVF